MPTILMSSVKLNSKFDDLSNKIIPYSLTDHIHEREISSQLGHSVAFIPSMGNRFRGILVKLSSFQSSNFRSLISHSFSYS